VEASYLEDSLPLKITIDGRCLTDHYPGIGRYLFNLLLALPEVAQDTALSVLTPQGEGSPRFDLETLEARGIQLVPVDVPIRGLRQQVELPKVLRKLEAEIFHAPYFITTYRPPCPMLVGIYDTITEQYPETLPSLEARTAARLGMRMALRSAHTLLTLSRASKKALIETYNLESDRIVVTPGAAPDGFQPADEAAIEELRSRLSLPGRYALHVGTNKPHKNLERLLKAWAKAQNDAEVGSKLADCSLVFAGVHDPRHPQPRVLAREMGLKRVRFLGAVDESDLATLYSGAAVFLMPSFVEGFGLPVLEAMACGVPVACARSASLPEVAGHAAIYFDPLDEGSIATALARVLKNPSYRKVLGERGRVRAGQLTWKHTARLTLDAYRRAAS